MPKEITVPRVGWSMEEGTFSGWLKQNGDPVSVGEPLFLLESEKVTMEVEALDSGILFVPAGAPETGATVYVGQRLAFLLALGEVTPDVTPDVTRSAGEKAEGGRSKAEGVGATAEGARAAGAASRAEGAGALRLNGRTLVTPRARRVAAELGVDIATLHGSGRGGRIREADVRAAGVRTAPISVLRRTIASRMVESRQNTAPVTLTTRADATALVALREDWRRTGAAPSYTDILAKLVAVTLERHPALNGRWEGDRIVGQAKVHIGIAVDTPQGLLAPVLRDVGTTGLAEVARRSRALIDAARARRLRAEDLEGGTFTITNLGGYGIDAFTPILNYPETAVLGVGAIRKEAVVLESGALAACEQITLSLTFDHRVVDGAPAARFLQALVRLIEAPPGAVQST